MFDKLFGRSKDTKTDSTVKEVENETLTTEIVPASSGNATIESSDVVDHPLVVDSYNEEPQKIPPLTHKEMKALKRSRYEKDIRLNPQFKKAYLLENIKTGQMAEIRAASSFHACNIIGWRANKVRLVSEKVIEEKSPETTSSSNKSS